MYWQGVLVREPRVCFRSRGSVFLALRPSTMPNEKPRSQSYGSLGTPGRHEPRSPLARPRQGERSARTVSAGVRVVYGGVRHARFEGGEGVVGGVGGIRSGPRHERNQRRPIALRDNAALICIFLCIVQ